MTEDDTGSQLPLYCVGCGRELAVDGSEEIYRDESGGFYCVDCAADDIATLIAVADLSGLLDF